MKFLKHIVSLLVVFLAFNSYSQYYTQAAMNAIDAGRTGVEGDLYMDTLNNDLRIGLTHGKLGDISDDQNIDSMVLGMDSLYVYLENGGNKAVYIGNLLGRGVNVGDIKTGIQTTDHDGWYLLDGRSLLTLPAGAQINAATLGIVGTLPDLSDRIDKTNTGVESIFATGGGSSQTLAQANLPSYNLTGNTSSDGAHTHTVTIDSAGDHQHNAQQQNIGLGKKGFTSSNSNKDSIIVKDGAVALSFDPNGLHTHNMTFDNSATHTHTVSVSSGGSGTSFSIMQPYMVVNRFIYLGL